jgi:hypothetical protein
MSLTLAENVDTCDDVKSGERERKEGERRRERCDDATANIRADADALDSPVLDD